MLGFRQGEGQGGKNFLPQAAVAFQNAAGLFFDLLADNGQGELIGQEFIVGQAAATRGVWADVVKCFGHVGLQQGFPERKKMMFFDEVVLLPFRKIGHPLQSLADELVEHFVGQAGRQRINRLNANNLFGVFGTDNVIRVGHLFDAVKAFNPSADDALFADGKIFGN